MNMQKSIKKIKNSPLHVFIIKEQNFLLVFKIYSHIYVLE